MLLESAGGRGELLENERGKNRRRRTYPGYGSLVPQKDSA